MRMIAELEEDLADEHHSGHVYLLLNGLPWRALWFGECYERLRRRQCQTT